MEREASLMEPKLQCYLSYWGDKFMVPSHEKKGDYYVNLCLSQLTNELKH